MSGIIALIILNEKMDNTMKTNKPLEESGLFIKGINETIENEAKKQRDRFLTMLLGTFGVSSFHF